MMLSRSFLKGVHHDFYNRCFVRIAPVAARLKSTDGDIKTTLETWDKAHEKYFGPERDTKNFPHIEMPDNYPKVRIGFIPDSWFQAFYDKTGVTGPYLIGVGGITFLLSKEIWVPEHGMTEFLAFWLAIYMLNRFVGKRISDYFSEEYRNRMDYWFTKPVKLIEKRFTATAELLEKTAKQQEGLKYLFQAKRENVDVQLEEEYRRRMAIVHQTVKRRLDYHVELDATKRRYEQQHMVSWIVNNVIKGITPQLEKDTMAQCIQTLKTMSAKA